MRVVVALAAASPLTTPTKLTTPYWAGDIGQNAATRIVPPTSRGSNRTFSANMKQQMGKVPQRISATPDT